jgi:hypothetical protein
MPTAVVLSRRHDTRQARCVEDDTSTRISPWHCLAFYVGYPLCSNLRHNARRGQEAKQQGRTSVALYIGRIGVSLNGEL